MTWIRKTILRTVSSAGIRFSPLFQRTCLLERCHQILVFQGGGIGDIIRVFPLILALHDHFPKAALFTLTPFSDSVFQLFPKPQTIMKSLLYDPIQLHRGPLKKWRLVQKLRSYAFDLIFNTARGEGMPENTILSFAMGAPHRVGFERDGAGFLNTVRVPLQDDRPIVDQNLDLLRAIGVIPKAYSISLRISEKDQASADLLLETHRLIGEQLVALHPGSYWRHHLRWPLERYISLIKVILQQHLCKIVFLGSQGETPLIEKIMSSVKDPRLIDLTGKTTLSQAAALLSRFHLFIGNDSGLLHIALALKTPSIGIFGYTSPRQVISPVGPCIALHKAMPEELYLHQPFFDFNPNARNPIERIEVEDVLDAIKTLLSSDHPLNPHP